VSASPPRLVRRVAIVGGAWAAVAGAVAAVFAGVLTGGLVARHEDHTVLAATRELADEVDDELDRDPDEVDDDDDDIEIDREGRPVLASVLSHELNDVKEPGASAAIVDGGRTVVGDASLPELPAGECTTTEHSGSPRRVCAELLADGTLVLLAVSAEDERERWGLMAWGLLGGALLGAAIGGIASHRSASWTIAPLTALGDRVRRIDAEAPHAELLDPPARHAEIEELRAAIAQLVERLGVSLGHAQSFAAQAAHELRTPLALLAGELELMIEREPGDASELRRLHGQVQGLIRLAQRLLVLAGPGRAPAEHGEAVDLADVVELIRVALPSAASERLRVELDDDVIVRGDPELLRSMIHNAVENAMKFSDGPVDLRIRGDARATIDIVDRGPGIPREDRDKVFNAFYRRGDPRTRGTPGHGVGLALVAHVATAHGGHVELRDAAVGTHLRVELPRWSGS
jgi:two-component system, OmpR family, sensor kinase